MSSGRYGAVELHCHLDGCVRPCTIEDLARQQGIELPGPAAELAVVAPECRSLVEYISAIDVALDVLQTPDALHRAAYELVEDWQADGVVHGEARFAPELHTRFGMAYPEIIEAVASGLREGQHRTGVSTALILSCMRPSDPRVTWAVVEQAASSSDVAGIDVAGPEYGVPLMPHAEAFRAAKEAGLRVTVHAGEVDGPVNVWQAVDELGAERIGHGVRSIQDAALVARLAADQIALELCPTSNLQTRAIAAIADHPIERFRAEGVPVTLSTDARTVSQVTLESEYELLQREFGWTPSVWNEAQVAAGSAAFVGAQQGAQILAHLKA